MNIDLGQGLLAVTVGFCATLLSQGVLSQLSYRWQLLDKPGAHRTHDRETPLVGGLSVYFGLLAALLCTDLPVAISMPLILGSGLVVLTGTLDDLYDLPSRYRFLSQVLAATIVCGWGDVRLLDFGVLWPGGEPLLTGSASLGVSLFAMVGLMNATNMSDGIDGQCGVLAVVALCALCVIASINGQGALITLTSIIFANALAFLLFNLKLPWRARAHVFLGDAGSMLLGFLLAWCFIVFSQVSPPSSEIIMQPVTALWLVALPLFDTLAVLVRRLMEGQSPFLADRSHYHHLLTGAGLSAGRTTLVIAGVAGTFAAVGVVMEVTVFADDVSKTGHLMIIFIIGFCVYFATVNRIYRRFRAARNPSVVMQPSLDVDSGFHGDNILMLRPRVVSRDFADAADNTNQPA